MQWKRSLAARRRCSPRVLGREPCPQLRVTRPLHCGTLSSLVLVRRRSLSTVVAIELSLGSTSVTCPTRSGETPQSHPAMAGDPTRGYPCKVSVPRSTSTFCQIVRLDGSGGGVEPGVGQRSAGIAASACDGVQPCDHWQPVVAAGRFEQWLLAHPERGLSSPAVPVDVEHRSVRVTAVEIMRGWEVPNPVPFGAKSADPSTTRRAANAEVAVAGHATSTSTTPRRRKALWMMPFRLIASQCPCKLAAGKEGP